MTSGDKRTDLLERGRGVAGLADNLHIRHFRHGIAQGFAHQAVIIDEEYPNGH